MAKSNANHSSRLRIGAVNYLNTKPLIRGLRELAPHADLRMDLPSRLADTLAARRVDVALIPVVELLDRSDYTVVSNACIGCQGNAVSGCPRRLSRLPKFRHIHRPHHRTSSARAYTRTHSPRHHP